MKRIKTVLMFGLIISIILLSDCFTQRPVSAAGANFIVDSVGDEEDKDLTDGICKTINDKCTLRAAIQNANKDSDADTITISITPFVIIDGVITVGSALPPITAEVTIQVQNPAGGGIVINGAGISADGLQIADTADNTSITGIKISNFGKSGIKIDGADNVTISECVIGETKVLFSTYPGNKLRGIDIVDAAHATIENNLISGNGSPSSSAEGIRVYRGEFHTITGNKIGTDSTGSKAQPNTGTGINIFGSTNNLIGGTLPANRNIISGNGGNGIYIWSGEIGGIPPIYEAKYNRVAGNYFGTNITGTFAIPNDGDGITLYKDLYTLIGGNATGEGNLISGNADAGIRDSGKGSTIRGNTIGLNAAKKKAIPNQFGIKAYSPESAVIGGLLASDSNTIAYNIDDGIYVHYSALMKQIKGNAIFGNGGLGINLVADAQEGPSQVTPNDEGDGDIGGNNLQNFPIITATEYAGTTSVTVQGNLNSSGEKLFILHFYGNDECDPSGYGEGQVYLGTTDVTTNADHNVNFTKILTVTKEYDCISVTAMDGNGNTSEFFSFKKPPDAMFIFLPLIIH